MIQVEASLMSHGHSLVLVVDDCEDTREMYAEYLTGLGFGVSQAGDGAEAVRKAKELAPDVVVLDMSLPVIDGWEVARQLRGTPETHAIPLVALSGYDPRDMRDARCNAYLVKPCLPAALVASIRRVLDETAI